MTLIAITRLSSPMDCNDDLSMGFFPSYHQLPTLASESSQWVNRKKYAPPAVISDSSYYGFSENKIRDFGLSVPFPIRSNFSMFEYRVESPPPQSSAMSTGRFQPWVTATPLRTLPTGTRSSLRRQLAKRLGTRQSAAPRCAILGLRSQF